MKACFSQWLSHRMAIAVAVVVAGIALTLAACAGTASKGSSTPLASLTPSSLAASPLATAAPPSGAELPARQLVIAVASGLKANGVSAVSSSGRVRQLVAPHGAAIRSLAWSPDGNRLAYLQSRGKDDLKARLWCYDAATGRTAQIMFPNEDNEAWVSGFTWVGPTELIVAVMAGGPPYSVGGGPNYRGNGVFWRCDVAADNRTAVRDDHGKLLRGSLPSSSADGAKIAYVFYGARSQLMGHERLMVLDAVSHHVSTVAKGGYELDIEGDSFAFPLISPHGSLIYTTSHGNDPGFDCNVYRLDGSKALASEDLYMAAPASWSPAGQLAFAGASHLQQAPWWAEAIHVWEAGAAKPTAMSPRESLWVTSLAWSPKATQIAYTVATHSWSQGTLWVVNRDGTNRHPLLAHGSWPAWALAPIAFP